jgi:sugar O-acyltransferase (sialic acid O-acetyltransferase NeuD family)
MKEFKDIYLFGGGGHAKVVMDVLRSHFGDDCIAGLFDDDLNKKNTVFYNSKIIGPIEPNELSISNLMIAIGDNRTRKKKSVELQIKKLHFITGIHPSAIISTTTKIGNGTIIMPGVSINADSIINDHCILNTNSLIEHDCIVENFVHIAPGVVLTGGVEIGELSFIGANSTILPGVKIGKNCKVGAGSVVRKNVPDNSLVYGNPFRIVKNFKNDR